MVSMIIAYCINWLENNWKNYSKSKLVIRKAKKSLSCYTQDMLDHLNAISGNSYGTKFPTSIRCYIGTDGSEPANINGEIHIVRKKGINWDCAQDKYFQKYPNDVKGSPWVNNPITQEEWRRIFEKVPFWKSADATLPLINITANLDNALDEFCKNLNEFEKQILSL